MAKGKSKANATGGRGHNTTSNPRLLRPMPSPVDPVRVTPALEDVAKLSALQRAQRALEDLPTEDRRRWNPDPNRTAKTLSGRRPSVVLRDRPLPKKVLSYAKYKFGAVVRSQTKAALGFHTPEAVSVCVRRWTRKEVLFAKKKAGRGIKKFFKPRVMTALAKISCRRRK